MTDPDRVPGLATILRSFQESCEQIRDVGRAGGLAPRGVTNALRRRELECARAILAELVPAQPSSSQLSTAAAGASDVP
jgi:hypothetical protein